MRTLKSIMLLFIGMMGLMTGFANNPTARDVGPPGTESAKYENNVCVYPASDLVVTDAYLLVNPADVLIVSTDSGKYVFVSKKEDPAPAEVPGTIVKISSNLAFMDRHRRTSGSDNESYENNTRFITTAFIDRHRR